MLKIVLIASVICCSAVWNSRAQGKAFRIYGEVTTVMNKKISGYITWGKNQYWTDIFSASKVENPYARYKSVMGNARFANETSENPAVHEFACRFGNIRSVRVTGEDRVELVVKDGNLMELTRGHSRVVGNTISVESVERGVVPVPWDHISEVVFSGAPATTGEPKDLPITGIVETPYGMYKGIVQWDLDENSLSDLLDGKTGESDISVSFSNIQSIRSLGNSCSVVLKSGREIVLWGENDVNEENRGIAVSMPSVGQVIVRWRDFKSFKAIPAEQVKLMTYADFALPVRLHGVVETRDGQLFEGMLAYDLDEAMDFELLDGQNGHLTYRIPFRFIRTIEPKNYKYTWMQLIISSLHRLN